MSDQIFHIYKKSTNEVVTHSLSIDQMETMIAKKEIDWKNWEVQPIDMDCETKDASY